jgi:hypothetical protein
MIQLTIEKALLALGFDRGWAATEYGIVLWEHERPQPDEDELEQAGWVKPKEDLPQ